MIRAGKLIASSTILAALVAPSHAGAKASPLLADAKKAVCDQLRDCDTAHFREVRSILSKQTDGSMKPIVCGEVNAKNGFGGYVGFEPFVYYPKNGLVIMRQSLPGATDETVRGLCSPGTE